MATHLFGIRHHGPGCARALQRALAELQPDCILLEGPPEADALTPLVADAGLQPPVALLVYPPQAAAMGVFYPLAEFSPEWCALRHAAMHGVPASFIDLPHTHEFARRLAQQDATGTATEADPDLQQTEATPAPAVEEDDEAADQFDPIAELSAAAGFDDPERWWEQHIEQRHNSEALFEAIAEAMTALRAAAPAPSLREQRREAHMRHKIRAAEKQGYQRIAVVCGAWHVPALAARSSVKDDSALLRGLPRTRTEAVWIPWSHDRLAQQSGYGAGVQSPGWYAQLWRDPAQPVVAWMTRAAQLQREQGLDASSASIIEAVRLAEALAAMRGCSRAGLAEINEAMLAVLCQGDGVPLQLIRQRLEVGDVIGRVPLGSVQLPLQQDVEAEQKRLRLKPSTEIKRLDLDLREDNGRGRSQLLHRLHILGVHWGEPEVAGNRGSTFHEYWNLQWQPQLHLALIDASRYGNTLAEAAAACLMDGAGQQDLPSLTARLDQALLAQLPPAMAALLQAVNDGAAMASDIQHLMQALLPLTRVARYGDVRGTGAAAVRPILASLVERIIIGLPLACAALDEDAANAVLEQLGGVQASLDTLAEAQWLDDWYGCLAALAHHETLPPAIRAYALRLLFDRQRVTEDELARLAGLALSPVVPPMTAALWLGGLLRGSGLLLLNQDSLWRILDAWVQGLDHAAFQGLLPLLRRAFSSFTAPERRRMHSKVRHLDSAGAAPTSGGVAVDAERAACVLPLLRSLMGVNNEHAA